jgi:thymidylate synthase
VKSISVHTPSEAYLRALREIYYCPEYTVGPRGLQTREITDSIFEVLKPSSEPIKTLDLDRNKIIAEYTRKEIELYESATNRVEDFQKASSFWSKIANPDGTINSAYGWLIYANKSYGNQEFELGKMRTPWEWAKLALISDKDTRQAILLFSLPKTYYRYSKDVTCCINCQFLVRDNKLHLSVNFRSNDCVRGLPYDMPWLMHTQSKMLQELLPVYPELTLGTYRHHTASLHIYEADIAKVKKMLGLL